MTNIKFEPGDKVMFKPNYLGPFMPYRSVILTVNHVITRDDGKGVMLQIYELGRVVHDSKNFQHLRLPSEA